MQPEMGNSKWGVEGRLILNLIAGAIEILPKDNIVRQEPVPSESRDV